MSNDSYKQLKDYLTSKGGYDVSPSDDDFESLFNLLNDMESIREVTQTSNTNPSFEKIYSAGSTLADCSCDSEVISGCDCDNRCACNSEIGTGCDCDSRCSCNNVCSCNSNLGSCSCKTYCDCQSQCTCNFEDTNYVTCFCDYDCQSNTTCDCWSRCACDNDCSCNGCDCEGDCACNARCYCNSDYTCSCDGGNCLCDHRCACDADIGTGCDCESRCNCNSDRVF